MTIENKSYALFLTMYVKEFQNDAIWDTPKLKLELSFGKAIVVVPLMPTQISSII